MGNRVYYIGFQKGRVIIVRYERMKVGRFIDRPNRFIAHVEIDGEIETVHVKNTGRCAELLTDHATVFVQKSNNPERKTQWDLIAVQKGNRMVNMDSQITNVVVEEWIRGGNLFEDVVSLRREVTFGKSRFDLYVETGNRKIFIEVKGVTLENDGVVQFPDAPSERAIKHVEELVEAKKQGYEAYVFFVVQMKDVSYFTPNRVTHEAFADVLRVAKSKGVEVIAYDCKVVSDAIEIAEEVPVVLEEPRLFEMRESLVEWYRSNKRDLPWRNRISAYRTWVSEIMLQQTRVEAVKPYFHRFLEAFPEVGDLASAEEEKLLKMWEGLGYYNRVRNMQLAAQQVMEDYGGAFPDSYDEILKLKGIGTYTAGAIASIAYGEAKPAVDGNVLRVITRILGDDSDIMKASVKKRFENALEEVIPEGRASDFNQGLIELGAIVCVPNGKPRCEDCPAEAWCLAKKEDRIHEIPVKTKSKDRRIEKRTVLIFKDGEKIAIRKRPKKGLLAGLYEFPNVEGYLTMKEVTSYSKFVGVMPIKIRKLESAKHIFSHIEWHMIGYEIRVDELEEIQLEQIGENEEEFGELIFSLVEEIQERYPIPTAFQAYTREIRKK